MDDDEPGEVFLSCLQEEGCSQGGRREMELRRRTVREGELLLLLLLVNGLSPVTESLDP